jgi:cysteinyl-tRNA synthetase, unknown class
MGKFLGFMMENKLPILWLLLFPLCSCETEPVPDTQSVPHISMLINGKDIASGESYDFGAVRLNSAQQAVVSIKNTGPEYLQLTGHPPVSISGADALLFTVPSQPSSSIEPHSRRDFTLVFTPPSLGAKTAALSIESNDPDEGVCTLGLQGTGSESNGLVTVDDFAYQLQGLDLSALAASAFDLAIIDYSQDGSDEMRLTPGEISAVQHGSGGEKLVLAYMSIGEAEDYRWYWDERWDKNHDGNPNAGAPSWLGPGNPEWLGNYKVRYWDPEWQAIIFGSPTSYLDKIMAAGFDGVYLDIIDAYEYWGPGGESGLRRKTAEQEMVDFVKAIAQYAHVAKGKTDFGIFPQNGEGLSTHVDYVQSVTGIGKEDTWYNDNLRQPSSYTAEVIENLDVFKRAGKLVLVTDYVTQKSRIDDFYAKAWAHGYVPYATIRDLDALTINPGHEPD